MSDFLLLLLLLGFVVGIFLWKDMIMWVVGDKKSNK